MTFVLQNERLPVDRGWGVLYSVAPHRQLKENRVAVDQDGLVALMEKIKTAEQSAMAEFYDATINRVFGLSMKIVLRSELAEEVVSDVYLQVWRQAKNFNPERASPIGWLLMICRSRALDMLRREKSATRNQYQGDDQHNICNKQDENIEIPLDDIIKSEISGRVSAALQLLNKKQRQTITLAFYRDMSHQEIADYTGQPLGTVKSNIRRAQDILRNVLSRDDLVDLGNGGLYEKA